MPKGPDASLVEVGSHDSALVGEHEVRIRAYYEQYPRLEQLEATIALQVTLEPNEEESKKLVKYIDMKPKLTLPPSEKRYSVSYGSAWSLDLGLVSGADLEAVNLSLTCTTNATKTFLSVQADTDGFQRLQIEKGTTLIEDLGAYDFELVLKGSLDETVYRFRVKITTPEKLAMENDAKTMSQSVDALEDKLGT